jgi:orotidine-5'-phosphate decarboxylase
VAGAVAAATRLGVWMLNVHASGGSEMMRAAREAADEEAARLSVGPPLVTAVTVLTSLDDKALQEVGVAGATVGQVERLALLAQGAGLDGVVASPQEVGRIRACCDPRFAIVTPGIREGRSGVHRADDDQTRTGSAADSLQAGSSYLVVGRPIIASPDPRAAAERMAAECLPAAP